MKTFLIATALVLSSTVYAQESVPDGLLAFADPPASTERFDNRPGPDLTHMLIAPVTVPADSWITNSLSIVSDASSEGISGLIQAASASLIPVVLADFPTEADALDNLQNTLDNSQSQYQYYDYFLEEGGLKLPLSW